MSRDRLFLSLSSLLSPGIGVALGLEVGSERRLTAPRGGRRLDV